MKRFKATFGRNWMMASLVLAVMAVGAGGCDLELDGWDEWGGGGGGGDCYFDGGYVDGWCYYPSY